MRARTVISLGLIPLGLLLSVGATRFPNLVERVYALALYRWLLSPWSRLTGIFPFSMAELLLILTVIASLFFGLRWLIRFLRAPKFCWRTCLRGTEKLLLGAGIIYLTFMVTWGLNYQRQSFAEISSLPVQPAAVEDVAALAADLVLRANQLRGQVREDEQGVMTLTYGVRDMLKRANAGFEQAAKLYPELGGNFGTPKGVLLSGLLSRTGISGVYFPWTGEANVNIASPHCLLPATTLHEMAHQRGFAREDEANYIGYLTATLHPDPDFQYSGVLLALIHTMNTLARYDADQAREIRAQYSDGVVRDLVHHREYWQRFEGPIERASTRVNDSYLRANRQADGVRSYGRMVDLLLAEYRINN